MSSRPLAAMLVAAGWLVAADFSLLDAVKRRDPKAVESLLHRHADVNAAQPDGATPLAWAVHNGDRAMAEMLLAAGAKVDAANEYGETPLTLACLNGDAVLVSQLLKAGADAKAARWNGETALMIASGVGSADVVRSLIAHGAGVNTTESRKGQSAIHWAAAEGHSDVVRLLIEHGASVNAASKGGFTALAFAAIKNDPASVRALLAAGADENYALPDGTKVLMAAASHHSTAAALELLDDGADPNIADRTGNTVLHTAAQAGDVALIRKLIAKWVPVDPKTAEVASGRGTGGFRFVTGAQTPLFLAARAGQIEAMRALIEARADTQAKAQDGSSFLMAAVGSGKVEVVRFAYEYDPGVKIVTSNGATLMHASVTGTSNGATQEAQERVCEVIRFLAEKGAPLDEKNANGRTPIDLADILPIDKAVDLLTKLILKSGATPKSPSKR